MKHLFDRDRLSNYLDKRTAQMLAEVEKLPAVELTSTPEEELCQGIVKRYSLASPRLDRNGLYMHPPKETKVDVSQDPNRFIRDRSRPFYLPGTQFSIVVPFKGDPALFDYLPSSFTTSIPSGDVDPDTSELTLVYTQVDPNPEEIKRLYERELDVISQYLAWVTEDIAKYNSSLEPSCVHALTSRKTKLQSAELAAKGLGIPIRPPKR